MHDFINTNEDVQLTQFAPEGQAQVTWGNCLSAPYWSKIIRETAQLRERATLNDKAHFLYRSTPSRQGEIAVSHHKQKQTQGVSKMRKQRKMF